MTHTFASPVIIRFQTDSQWKEDVTLTYPDIASAIEYASTHAHEYDNTFITTVNDPDYILIEWENN